MSIKKHFPVPNNMKYIVITSPTFLTEEAALIAGLFRRGLDILHLRKPQAEPGEVERLLRQIPEEYYGRIVVHDHFVLCRDYGLRGIHLNSRHPQPPVDFHPRSVSASCHSIEEVRRRKAELSYVTLSPIFNSISKQGYQAAYTSEQLAQAASEGIIDEKVVALGGVTFASIPQLRQWHFGGAAFLGEVWSKVGTKEFDGIRF